MNWYHRWARLFLKVCNGWRGTIAVKMGELIPSLKHQNIYVRHRKPENLSPPQLNTIFHIMDQIAGSKGEVTKEEQKAFFQYQKSFLNKRILQEWKKIRPGIYVRQGGAAQDELMEAAFLKMKPILYKSFYESCQGQAVVINAFTLRAFVWNHEYLTRKFGLVEDHQYWLEILEMIDDIKKNAFQTKKKSLF
jgi:hypothetical protein